MNFRPGAIEAQLYHDADCRWYPYNEANDGPIGYRGPLGWKCSTKCRSSKPPKEKETTAEELPLPALVALIDNAEAWLRSKDYSEETREHYDKLSHRWVAFTELGFDSGLKGIARARAYTTLLARNEELEQALREAPGVLAGLLDIARSEFFRCDDLQCGCPVGQGHKLAATLKALINGEEKV